VKLPGKCVSVYLILLQLARFDGTNSVVLTTARLKDFGLGRGNKARSLDHMEQAGIIRVESRGRNNPLIHLLLEIS
jgi:hypothetical protein